MLKLVKTKTGNYRKLKRAIIGNFSILNVKINNYIYIINGQLIF